MEKQNSSDGFINDPYNTANETGLLTMLQDISKQLVSQFDLKTILDIFLDTVEEIIRYNSCVLFFFDDHTKPTRIMRQRGENSALLKKYVPDVDIITWILKEGTWSRAAFIEQVDPEDSRVLSVLPVQGIKIDFGFLMILTDSEENIFTPINIKLLTYIADQAGIALENQKLYSDLDKSRKYADHILENIINGIVAMDSSGKITHINKNATAILGIESVNVIGRMYTDVLSYNLIPVLDEVKREIMENGFSVESVIRHSPFDNMVVHIGINATLLQTTACEISGVIYIFRDLSTTREIERLKQLDTLKSEFVSNVSHELRTPISIVKSYTEAILTQVEEDDHETRNRFLNVINDETDRLSDLVNDLLDISHIESGLYLVEKHPVPLKETILEVVERLKDKLSDNHTVKLSIPDTLKDFSCDRDKMIQVFINLITNAVKFSPAGGLIHVSVEETEESLVISVEDQGIGMEKTEISSIFKKFYRIDNSDRYEIAGTGLGLSIVKYIVEKHHGKIEVESEVNKGSCFTLSFRG